MTNEKLIGTLQREEFQDKMERLLYIFEKDETICDFVKDLPDNFDDSEVTVPDIRLLFIPKERYYLETEDGIYGKEIFKETLDTHVKTKTINLIRDNVDDVLLEE